MLCAVLYRPSRYNKDFINNFSVFLSEIMPKYDHVLIVGDFNVHVCCLEKQMAKDFLYLIDSFNLVQSVSWSCLILWFACSKSATQCFLTMSVLFDIAPACNTVEPHAAAQRCRINSSTAVQFASVFSQNYATTESICNDSEELSSWLHSTCQIVMDTVPPLKIRQPKTKFEPWLNDTVRTVRHESRRAERKWEKDKLHFKY